MQQVCRTLEVSARLAPGLVLATLPRVPGEVLETLTGIPLFLFDFLSFFFFFHSGLQRFWTRLTTSFLSGHEFESS